MTNFRQKKADGLTIGLLAMRRARIYKLLQQVFALGTSAL